MNSFISFLFFPFLSCWQLWCWWRCVIMITTLDVLCILRNQTGLTRFPLLRLPQANAPPLEPFLYKHVFGRSFPWSLLNVSPSVCLTIPHHPTIASQNRHWMSICRRLQLKTQDCRRRNRFPPKVNTYHLAVTYNYITCFPSFFVNVFQDQSNGHQHHSTAKWSPFAGFPILAKLFSIEGTGRTLAIAIGVVLILGFEWRAPGQTKTMGHWYVALAWCMLI